MRYFHIRSKRRELHMSSKGWWEDLELMRRLYRYDAIAARKAAISNGLLEVID